MVTLSASVIRLIAGIDASEADAAFGHMQKRACDERAIIGSRRLRRFFILTCKRGDTSSQRG